MNPPLASTLAVMLLTGASLAFAAPGPPEGATAETTLKYPITPLQPNNAPPPKAIANPAAGDAGAPARGMQDFIAFNCVGCHAPNGAGGMGPSLSDAKWLYGSEPAQIFSSIYEGRPKGMPAWGRALPASTIWDLVAYIQGITEAPQPKFGKTVSLNPPHPQNQQVPAEFVTTTEPWRHLQPFSAGQKPEGP